MGCLWPQLKRKTLDGSIRLTKTFLSFHSNWTNYIDHDLSFPTKVFMRRPSVSSEIIRSNMCRNMKNTDRFDSVKIFKKRPISYSKRSRSRLNRAGSVENEFNMYKCLSLLVALIALSSYQCPIEAFKSDDIGVIQVPFADQQWKGLIGSPQETQLIKADTQVARITRNLDDNNNLESTSSQIVSNNQISSPNSLNQPTETQVDAPSLLLPSSSEHMLAEASKKKKKMMKKKKKMEKKHKEWKKGKKHKKKKYESKKKKGGSSKKKKGKFLYADSIVHIGFMRVPID